MSLKYTCKTCNFITSDKRDLKRHNNTKKHKKKLISHSKTSNDDVKMQELFICEYCQKEYKYRSGLSRHTKKCLQKNQCKKVKKQSIKNEANEVKINKTDETKDNASVNALVAIIKQQQEQLDKTHKLLEKTIESNSEMIPKIGNNNNNKISINVFLNENCKSAMNLTDFVQKLSISLDDINYTKQHGYIEGVTNLFTKQLKDLSPNQRPIHCSDKKRLQFYVKEDNKWEKDVAHEKIDKSIHELKIKQIKNLKKWEERFPNYLKDEKLLSEWQNLVHQMMGDGGDKKIMEKNNLLIKKNIATNVPVKDAITIK
tara:strand:+ start:598 stop:1539 length:942 start_codon:yes stop_codon:yes gene_type:complete